MKSKYDAELAALVETAQKFAKKEILGKVVKLDSLEKPDFPWAMIKSGGDAGFLTGPLSAELGGAELDSAAVSALVEHLAEGAAGPAMIFAAHLAALGVLKNSKSTRALLAEISESLGGEKPLLIGISIPATAVPVDRPALPLVEEKGGDVFISGDFIAFPDPKFCSYVLMATREKNGKVLLVESARLKDSAKKSRAGSGLDEMPSAVVALDNFKAGDDEIVGDADSAEIYRNARLYISAAQAGNARIAAQTALEYAKVRFQTGRLIIEHQEVRRMIESMNEKVDVALGALRLAEKAALEKDDAYVRRAFTAIGTMVEDVCQDAVQVHGGYGYMKDYGVEKRLRDAKSMQCLLGSYIEDILGDV